MPQPLFTVGQELRARRDHDHVPAGTMVHIERVTEPRPGEFEYYVEFDQGRRTIMVESTLRALSR